MHFGNDSTGCWLGYGGDCLMQLAGLWRRLSYAETVYSENHWECF